MRDTLAFLGLRKKSYQSIFGAAGAAGSEAMKDLAKFCYANNSTAMPDQYLTATLNGRREVWLRICQHLHISEEELTRLYQAVVQGE